MGEQAKKRIFCIDDYITNFKVAFEIHFLNILELADSGPDLDHGPWFVNPECSRWRARVEARRAGLKPYLVSCDLQQPPPVQKAPQRF